MKLNFSGKKVLVTGGNCSIALSLSRLLIEEGLFPVLTARGRSGEDKIKNELSVFHGKFETIFMDLAAPGRIGDIFREHDDIDYLVDMAQGNYETLVASADQERLSNYMSENVAARAELVRLASRSMLRRRFGRMVFVSSSAAGMPAKGQGLYVSSKLAAEGLYRSTGLELASRGVTAMTLRPGYVDSGRGREFIEKDREGLLKKIPGGRFISPEEVARSLVFFLSDSSLAFNGVEITMDGGVSAGKN